MYVKQVTIGKRVSLTFLALLEVSVGAVREISRIAVFVYDAVDLCDV
jgi:hypothetical protein